MSRTILAALYAISLVCGVFPMAALADADSITISPLRDFYAFAVAIEGNGDRVAVGQDSTILVYDRLRQQRLAVIKSKTKQRLAHEDRSWIMSLDFSPNGGALVAARGDGTFSIFSGADYGEVVRVEIGKLAVLTVRYSPDGRYILAGGRDRKLVIWNVAKRAIVQSCTADGMHWVHAAAWSHDGRQIAGASEEGGVRVWNAADGKLAWAADSGPSAAKCVCFSTDDRFVISGDQFNRARAWNSTTGRLVSTFLKHSRTVEGVQVLQDGATALTCGGEGVIQLWNIQNAEGVLAVEIQSKNPSVVSSALSRDGRFLICGLFDAVYVLRLESISNGRGQDLNGN